MNGLFSATTGHGKSACDAMGGLCKHFATKFNLQRVSVCWLCLRSEWADGTDNWYISKVTRHYCPAKRFQWPEETGKKKDECPVPLGNVLLTVRKPTLFGPSARLHTFDQAELIKIQQIYCH
ncbi:hypothetical protein PR048_008662 [Dryococelus australis]|uniref:Uncharacterized protein n=1 Tax=Dryococelus australis TaxID=614101 RepID=A0ABQ9HXR1_9NEOP|nr:hypothetical protein PR048_008662 [Dryococelus australis]